jgi:hypothetical protein
MTDLNAIKAERCPAVKSAMAEQAEPSRMKVEKERMFVIEMK